jgi:hypothetical protein
MTNPAYSRDESSVSVEGAAVKLAAAMPLALAAITVGCLIGIVGPVQSALLAVAVGMTGGILLGIRRPESVVLALIIVAVFLESPIVPAQGRYLPSLACIIAILVALAIRLAAGHPVRLPALPVAIALFGYVVAAAISTATSIDLRLSALYLGGMVTSLSIAFVAAPTLLSTAQARLAFVLTTAVIGLALAASTILLWLVGPLRGFSEPIGIYLVTELRLGDILTAVIVPRGTGPYIAPSYQALNLSIGLFALLALRTSLGRGRRLADLGIGLILVATLLTMARGGWLVAATGSLVVGVFYAIGAIRSEGTWRAGAWIDRWAVASFLVVGLALGLLLTNAIGADARYDLARIRYGDTASGSVEEELVTGIRPGTGVDPESQITEPLPVRGGAESSSRGAIWGASLSAIMTRPVTGFGPGTNADALAPFLTGPNIVYRGLTSHSTWFRTALEMGLPGLGFLIAFVLAAGWLIVQDVGRNRYRAEPWSGALIASAVALVVGQVTETLLLGGLTLASLYWAMAIGILVARPSAWRLGSFMRPGLPRVRRRTSPSESSRLRSEPRGELIDRR